MTPQEFKSWFDGFTEAFADDAPTYKQWSRIKARVAEIDGKPVTECIYVDRYWPQYPAYPLYPSYPRWHLSSAVGMSSTSNSIGGIGADQQVSFNSADAMNSLGRAEAQSLS